MNRHERRGEGGQQIRTPADKNWQKIADILYGCPENSGIQRISTQLSAKRSIRLKDFKQHLTNTGHPDFPTTPLWTIDIKSFYTS